MTERKRTEAELWNGTNDFNPEKLEELIELLEQGKVIQIYIDCIGFTRTDREGARYVNELIDKVGRDRLGIDIVEHPFYRDFTVWFKDLEG